MNVPLENGRCDSMIGRRAKNSAAANAPVTVSIPPRVTISNRIRLWSMAKSLGPTWPCQPPYSAPPSPAMPHPMTNAATLVAVTLMPSDAHAASLSFMAFSRRPNGPRRSARTPTARAAKITATSSRKPRCDVKPSRPTLRIPP